MQSSHPIFETDIQELKRFDKSCWSFAFCDFIILYSFDLFFGVVFKFMNGEQIKFFKSPRVLYLMETISKFGLCQKYLFVREEQVRYIVMTQPILVSVYVQWKLKLLSDLFEKAFDKWAKRGGGMPSGRPKINDPILSTANYSCTTNISVRLYSIFTLLKVRSEQ